MPAVTYLSDHEVRAWATVPDDKDCNEILQELRQLTGDNWIVGVTQRQAWPVWWEFWSKPETWKHYTLYADCHGEWQVINLVTKSGGSNFYASRDSRCHVMNFMLGIICGIHDQRKRERQ